MLLKKKQIKKAPNKKNFNIKKSTQNNKFLLEFKKKQLEIKKKLINLIMINGNKKTSEKILLKSAKSLQYDSKKQLKKIFQLAIINSSPIFKLHKSQIKKNKRKKIFKEKPVFISNTNTRTSSALKLILSNSTNKEFNKFFNELKKKLLETSQQKGTAIKLKNDLQKEVLLKKRLFKKFKKIK